MKYIIIFFILFNSFNLISQNKFEYNKGVKFEVYQGNEKEIKKYLEENDLDPIEGIWSFGIEGAVDGNHFSYDNIMRTAIIKDFENNGRDYIQILLSCDSEIMKSSGWKPNFIISKFDNTMYSNVFIEEDYESADELEGAPSSSRWYMEDIGTISTKMNFWSNGLEYDLSSEGIRLLPIYYSQKETENENEWSGSGSGFFISTDGYFVTNNHVIEDISYIEVEYTMGGVLNVYEAEIIQIDKQNDLAILKIKDKSFTNFTSIPYNFQTDIKDVGESVFALGYPKAFSGMGTEIKFTDGKISSKTGYNGDVSMYQTSTPIQPGNSGGPMFDLDGNLIGITTAKFNDEMVENVSYSVKSNYLKNLIDVLPSQIVLPSDKSLNTRSLTEKIKILSEYVVLIKVR